MTQPKGFFTEGGKKKPFHEKKGITEDKLNVSVKGNNDTITVKPIERRFRGSLTNLGAYFRERNIDAKTAGIDEVKRLAEKRHSHFFDADTMRFFNSRISDEAYRFGDKIYFITSEKGPSGVRKWTTRFVTEDGDINTLGQFQAYGSLLDARRAIRDFIEKK